jgi:hypothetical protein
MRVLALVGLLTASTCLAQEQVPGPQAPLPASQIEGRVAPEKQTITVPAGTRVPLTLTSPIHTKLARRGDAIRAVTAFPVTVGTVVVIPAGTFVEGVIDKATKRGPSGRGGLQIHFTRILFANGYNVPLDGATAEAKENGPITNFPEASRSGSNRVAGYAKGFQQPPPPPPPLPKVGPSIGLVTGIGLGVTAAVTVTAILIGRRLGGDTFFDTGYQFDMGLQLPLTLDADSVAAAVAGSNAQ